VQIGPAHSIHVAVPPAPGGQGSRSAAAARTYEVFGRHLPTFAGQLEQAVLVGLCRPRAFGQITS